MKLQLEAEVRLSSQSQAEVRRELTACESRLEEATRELKVALNRAESAESQAAQAMEETRCERISAGICTSLLQSCNLYQNQSFGNHMYALDAHR